MGYTNYMRRKPELDAKKFQILSEELSVAAGFMPGNLSSAGSPDDRVVVLCGGDGTGSPVFDKDVIVFNGEEKNDMCHETFVIERKMEQRPGEEEELVFDFCKTARKPYDIMVQVSMLRMKHHFPETQISSDGDSKEWANGRKLYKKIFNEAPPKMD